MSLDRARKNRNPLAKRRPRRVAVYLVIVVVVLFAGVMVFKNLSGDTKLSSVTGTKKTPPPALQTAEDYVNLLNYDFSVLKPDQRSIATVLHQELSRLQVSGDPLTTLNTLILPGLQKLQPGGDAGQVQAAIEQCRGYATEINQRYQDIPNDLSAKLISANVPPATAGAVANTFAEKFQTTEAVTRAAALSQVCAEATSLLELLAHNPTKWKRGTDGNLLSEDQEFTDQFNAQTQELNSAIQTLNGEE